MNLRLVKMCDINLMYRIRHRQRESAFARR